MRKTNKGGFRHCTNENVQTFTAYGEDSITAIRNVTRGIKNFEKQWEESIVVFNVIVLFDEELSNTDKAYSANAYAYGRLY